MGERLKKILKEGDKHVSLILRLCLGIVFLWAGTDKFLNPELWFRYVLESISVLISNEIIILVLAIIETILGLFLLIGLWSKVFGGITALYILSLIVSLFLKGVTDIAFFDIVLLGAALSLVFLTESKLSLDAWIEKKEQIKRLMGSQDHEKSI